MGHIYYGLNARTFYGTLLENYLAQTIDIMATQFLLGIDVI